MATADVAEKLLCCRIVQPSSSGFVEDVARYADTLQRLLEVAANWQAGGHHRSVADQRRVRPPRRAPIRPNRVLSGEVERDAFA